MINRIRFKLQIVIITGLLLVSGVVAPVYAQSTENCQNPGPYEICPPDTDLVIGSVTIPDSTLIILLAVFVAGLIVFIAGTNLNFKLNSHRR